MEGLHGKSTPQVGDSDNGFDCSSVNETSMRYVEEADSLSKATPFSTQQQEQTSGQSSNIQPHQSNTAPSSGLNFSAGGSSNVTFQGNVGNTSRDHYYKQPVTNQSNNTPASGVNFNADDQSNVTFHGNVGDTSRDHYGQPVTSQSNSAPSSGLNFNAGGSANVTFQGNVGNTSRDHHYNQPNTAPASDSRNVNVETMHVQTWNS